MAVADSVSLNSLVLRMRRSYSLPLMSAAIFGALACFYLWAATPLYEARVTITSRLPAGTELGGLSALGLGILDDLTEGGDLTSYEKLLEVVASEDTAVMLLGAEHLMAGLFPDAWDPRARQWNEPTGIVALLKEVLYWVFGLPGWIQPGAEPIVARLQASLRILPNDGGSTHTLLMYDRDPKIARGVLELLLHSADRLLRDRDRETNLENVRFLRGQMQKEEIVDVREVLSRRLGEEFVKSAMLEGSQSYAYEVLNSLTVSSRPVSPRPLLTLVISVFAGLLVGAGIVLLKQRESTAR